MTPIAQETLDYLRITNKAFGDKELVFTLMTNVLKTLPEFVRNEIIGAFLAIPREDGKRTFDERLLTFRTKVGVALENARDRDFSVLTIEVPKSKVAEVKAILKTMEVKVR